MRFHDPQLLALLFLLAPLALLIRRRQQRLPALPFAGPAGTDLLPDTLRCRLARLLPYLRLPILALMILALARPQTVLRQSMLPSQGRDLMLALDLSGSMLATDGGDGAGYRENRLQMAKGVLRDFIAGRAGDRIGLIAFAARPYPAAPLTLDHHWLQQAIGRLEVGAVEDGTALGDAIVSSLQRLRDKPAASRAVIVVTDGRSNAGTVSPALAAAAAKALGVRVHAIGIGKQGPALVPIPSPLGGTILRRLDADLDEATLGEIARTTGGSYFRADDRQMLSHVFQELDRLEKSTVRRKVLLSYRELYPPFLLAALALLVAGAALRQSVLRSLP